MRDRERRPDPSTLEYVLKVKKVGIVNCETILQVLLFEDELNAWMDELDRKEKELK